MSKLGMLGLLEGFGNGLTEIGQALQKSKLQEVQEQRTANRERLLYMRGRADKLADQKDSREYQEGLLQDNRAYQEQQYDKQLGDAFSDQVDAETGAKIRNKDLSGFQGEAVSTAKWNLDNKADSAFMEKANYYDQKLKAGEISEEQYNNAMGYSKQKGGYTPKERITMINKLRGDYEKDVGLLPAAEQPSFEQWVQQKRPEAWSMLGGTQQSGKTGIANTNSKPTEQEINQMFQALIQQDPSTWDQELEELRASGYTEAYKQLRSKVQKEQSRLKKEAKAEKAASQGSVVQPTRYNLPRDWEQNLSRKNPLQGLLEEGAAMSDEERQSAKQKRLNRMRKSFGGARPY